MDDQTPETEPSPEAESTRELPRAWRYDFADLPDGPLPASDWNILTGTETALIHDEAQAYTDRPKNVRIEDGELVIEAHKERYGDRDFTSGRISTEGKDLTFKYGTLTAVAKIPPGIGTWPAIWMMPEDMRYDAEDFGIAESDPQHWVLNGEIDFLEAIGKIPNENIPAAHSYNSLRSGETTYTPAYIDDAYGKYHRYGIRKTPNKIEFLLDDKVYATRERTSEDPRDWPFNQSYHLILNLAMGGNWPAGDKSVYPPYGIDDSAGSWQLRVKSLEYEPPQPRKKP